LDKKVILLDTSVLIDYFRKKDKTKTLWFELSEKAKSFAVSAITQYEIYSGAPANQIEMWDEFFKSLTILPFDSNAALISAKIKGELKQINKQIGAEDLFIAATAISKNIPCATLNKKHFERVSDLQLIN
jgi:predicted nucleic acid-binding protein